jgi:Sulfite exporter TauE/SafE
VKIPVMEPEIFFRAPYSSQRECGIGRFTLSQWPSEAKFVAVRIGQVKELFAPDRGKLSEPPADRTARDRSAYASSWDAVPLTLVAGLGHWLIGSVDWYIVGALLLGSLPGISIGSHVAARISDRFLLPVLASILVLIGLRLIAS